MQLVCRTYLFTFIVRNCQCAKLVGLEFDALLLCYVVVVIGPSHDTHCSLTGLASFPLPVASRAVLLPLCIGRQQPSCTFSLLITLNGTFLSIVLLLEKKYIEQYLAANFILVTSSSTVFSFAFP